MEITKINGEEIKIGKTSIIILLQQIMKIYGYKESS